MTENQPERDNHVYNAKLAEQAERYDGRLLLNVHLEAGKIALAYLVFRIRKNTLA